MKTWPKPRVVVSKCLGFDHCRYNGQIIEDEFVRQLRDYVTFVPVCAEVEIGLGVPRDPVRVVQRAGERRLLQPATGLDHTERMSAFAGQYLDGVGDVDGFLLKSRSPSCGIKDVKVYAEAGQIPLTGKAAGFFGAEVLSRFAHLAVEDEGRLTNYTLREHFLTRLYTWADWRAVRASGQMGALVAFQARNKLLLMAYNQTRMRALGRIVANSDKRPLADLLQAYSADLAAALDAPPRRGASINVLMHAFGYFDQLSAPEKAYLLDTLEKYRAQRIPLSVPLSVIRAWVVRFQQPYLAQQTFFEPYPEELVTVLDSGKGRAL
jgi:uncharacterized protein YbgA (DUF1722 family)/uncharacterized protein YbbK (DUF523 family)